MRPDIGKVISKKEHIDRKFNDFLSDVYVYKERDAVFVKVVQIRKSVKDAYAKHNGEKVDDRLGDLSANKWHLQVWVTAQKNLVLFF